MAEDKLIVEHFPNPKTKEQIIREEIAEELNRQMIEDRIKKAIEANKLAEI